MGSISKAAVKNKGYFREMCSDSEAGSCSGLIDFVYFSTLSLRVIKKKKVDQWQPAKACDGIPLIAGGL